MGVIVALTIISIWGGHLLYVLNFYTVDYTSFLTYLHILIQGYLYTGLFITAHDAMHGTVAKNRFINDTIGRFASILFAAFSYEKLRKKHYLHHFHVGTKGDPDFNVKNQNFLAWWWKFMREYLTIIQLFTMALLFNLLNVIFPLENIILFWIVPAFLGTFQLFYFGTFLPHRFPHTEEMEPHRARTQRKNHLWAMLSCYFFGYHWEHHQWPRTPWWRMYSLKDR